MRHIEKKVSHLVYIKDDTWLISIIALLSLGLIVSGVSVLLLPGGKHEDLFCNTMAHIHFYDCVHY